MLIEEHRRRILEIAEDSGCSTVVSFNTENTYYMTGFWGEGVSICSSEGTKIITPPLEKHRAENDASSCEVISADRGKDILVRLVEEVSKKSICTDCTDFSTIMLMFEKLGNKWVKVTDKPFILSRMIKDSDEQEKITKAANIIDILFKRCVEYIRVGRTEIELMAFLLSETFLLGGTLVQYKSNQYPFIIAGGPNSAFPHSGVTNRAFSKGDAVTVDLVVQYGGYTADATRTFVVDHVENEVKCVYECVKEAQQIGLDSLSSSENFGEVDLACRKFISDRGYGDKFIHSTGHGIGLEVHESPWIKREELEKVKPAMVVTIEPGVYMNGRFGVRIEDSVIIKTEGKVDHGVRSEKTISNLNSFTKELICLG